MEDLLVQLRGSRSDLAKIVEAAARTELAFIVVPAGAVHAWETREPSAWGRVRDWLTSRGKAVVERDDGTSRHASVIMFQPREDTP